MKKILIFIMMLFCNHTYGMREQTPNIFVIQSRMFESFLNSGNEEKIAKIFDIEDFGMQCTIIKNFTDNPELLKAVNIDQALAFAVKVNNFDFVKLVLEHGANPNAQSKRKKQTSLIIALKNGSYEICNLLLEKGANPNSPDGEGVTPLIYACQTYPFFNKNYRVLEKKGLDDCSKENLYEYLSKLKKELKLKHQLFITALLVAGADVTKQFQNKTANKWALDNGFFKLVELIKNYKTNESSTHVQDLSKKKMCDNCKMKKSTFVCSRCRNAYYCDIICQKEDRAIHKYSCINCNN